jgi:hypothetical protein
MADRKIGDGQIHCPFCGAVVSVEILLTAIQLLEGSLFVKIADATVLHTCEGR